MNPNVFKTYFETLEEEFKILPSDIAHLIASEHNLTFQGTKGVLSHLINRTRVTSERTMSKWFDMINLAVLYIAGGFYEANAIEEGDRLLHTKARMRNLVKSLN